METQLAIRAAVDEWTQIMLSQEEIVPFLQSRRPVDEERVVDGGLMIENVSRRNHNFKIIN